MIKLGNYIVVEHGYAFDSSQYDKNAKYRLVTLGNFNETNNCFDKKDSKATYTDEYPGKQFELEEEDLILPLTEQVVGLLGNSAFVPKAKGFIYVLNQRVGRVVIKSKDKIDKNYLHYLLATDNVKRQLENRASGTKQRNISPKDIYEVLVELPEINQQEKIGLLLRTIENKILVNNQINDNLSYRNLAI